jgi:hypothetical protein
MVASNFQAGMSKQFWIGLGTCVVGLGFAAYTGPSVFLIFLAGAILGSVWWALRARRLVVLVGGCLVLAATALLSNVVTDQLGFLTDTVLVPAYCLFLIGWPVILIGVLRLVFGKKTVLAITALLMLILFGFAVRVIWKPPSGYVETHLLLPTARLWVAGKRSNGYVHTLSWDNKWGDSNRIVVVTRRLLGHGETYWVWFSWGRRRGSGITRCDEWTAPQFPVFMTTDVYQPCFHFDERPRPAPPDRKLLVGPNFAEFNADDGKRMKVVW